MFGKYDIKKLGELFGKYGIEKLGERGRGRQRQVQEN